MNMRSDVWIDGTKRLDLNTWLFSDGSKVDFNSMDANNLTAGAHNIYLHLWHKDNFAVEDSYPSKMPFIIEWDN